MKQQGIVLVLLLLLALPAMSTDVSFTKCFSNRTLRVDLYHSGDARQEGFTIDRLYVQGAWAGNPQHLVDQGQSGRYWAKVYAADGQTLLFARGYDSYFGEFKTTDPALAGIKRTVHESVLMPLPQAKVFFTIEVRDRDNSFQQLFRTEIDPEKTTLIKEAVNPGSEVLELFSSGPAQLKVDLAFVAEGYRIEEKEKFRQDALRLLRAFFSQEPYSSLKERFNVRAIFHPSLESGCDEPSYGNFRNTALNSSFNSFGLDRYLLTDDNRALRDIAAVAPYDALIVLVNQRRYGGGGIYNLYAMLTVDNPWSDYMLIHEFGHSFAGLADEYYTSEVAYNDFYAKGVEPIDPNITALLDPQEIKWQQWLSKGIALPTPWDKEKFDRLEKEYQALRKELGERLAKLKRENAPEAEIKKLEQEQESASAEQVRKVEQFFRRNRQAGKVGAFEGAGYASQGLFRPMLDCIMFSKGQRPYCVVCREAVRRAIDFYTE